MQMELQENTVCYTKALCENDINCFLLFGDFLFCINLKKTRKLYKKRKLFLQNPLQFLFVCAIICPYVAQRRNDVKEHQNYEMRY